jgi:HTH-type transcriptional regulator / antitoxin HigA
MPNTTRSTQQPSRIEVFAIHSEADLALALEEIRALMGKRDLDRAEVDRLEVLSTLAEAYEDAHEPIPPAKAADAILFRLDQLGLTTKALEPILGSRARVYEVLHGTRTLSAQMMASLHARFDIPLESLVTAAAKRVARRKPKERKLARRPGKKRTPPRGPSRTAALSRHS